MQHLEEIRKGGRCRNRTVARKDASEQLHESGLKDEGKRKNRRKGFANRLPYVRAGRSTPQRRLP